MGFFSQILTNKYQKGSHFWSNKTKMLCFIEKVLKIFTNSFSENWSPILNLERKKKKDSTKSKLSFTNIIFCLKKVLSLPTEFDVPFGWGLLWGVFWLIWSALNFSLPNHVQFFREEGEHPTITNQYGFHVPSHRVWQQSCNRESSHLPIPSTSKICSCDKPLLIN